MQSEIPELGRGRGWIKSQAPMMLHVGLHKNESGKNFDYFGFQLDSRIFHLDQLCRYCSL